QATTRATRTASPSGRTPTPAGRRKATPTRCSRSSRVSTTSRAAPGARTATIRARPTTRQATSPSRARPPGQALRSDERRLGEGAVAVLVLLARAARAGGVPLHLAPGRGVGRIEGRGGGGGGFPRALRFGGATAIAAGTGGFEGELVLAGGGVDVMGFHRRKLGRLERRRLLGRGELDMHELPGHRLAQARQHVLEHGEALVLVFVERIALAVAAQADHLAKMLDHDEVLAP